MWFINDWFDILGVYYGLVLFSIVGGFKVRWGVWGIMLDIVKEIYIVVKFNMIIVSM